MPKFRKKPLVVEAEEWFPGRKVEGVEYRHDLLSGGYIYGIEVGDGLFTRVGAGDWVVRGPVGDPEVVKAAIFAVTYEPAEPQLGDHKVGDNGEDLIFMKLVPAESVDGSSAHPASDPVTVTNADPANTVVAP